MTTARDLPEEVVLGGARPLRGRLRIPGDKSISHRALLFGALARGRTRLTNVATGDDVGATKSVLEHLGVSVRRTGDATIVHGKGADAFIEPPTVLDCENSGTTMRVISGVLAGSPFLSVLTGDASLRQRPMRRVVEPLRAMGATIDARDDGRFAPLVIRGGPLRGMRHELAVASAQVKSALVLAGLRADGVTEVVSPATSRDHTERMLVALGAPIEVDGLTVRVRRGDPEPFDLDVPGDPSSSAFFVEQVSLNPTRLGFVDVLCRMGAQIDIRQMSEVCGEPVGELAVRSADLTGTTIGGEEIPNVQDEIPALAVAAAFADGVTDIRDAAELAVKESNRIGTLQQELTQLGIAVEARSDGLLIRGGRPRASLLKSHGDHRIAMAAAVAANAVDGETTVRGWRAVASSYPEFAVHFEQLIGTP